jgi:hypothetical protein
MCRGGADIKLHVYLLSILLGSVWILSNCGLLYPWIKSIVQDEQYDLLVK